MLSFTKSVATGKWRPVSRRTFTSNAQRTVTKLGKVSPRRPVPDSITRPSYVDNPLFTGVDMYGDMPVIPLMTPENLPAMRRSCSVARKVLDFAGTLVRPGITTEEIDAAVHQKIIESGAYPSTLGYKGYPKSCCTSINNIVCHGIPDDQALVDGDIINIDITVYLDGYHGDCSETFLVGNSVSDEAKRLVKVAREARDSAIAQCGPGKPLNVIGKAISDVIRRNGYTSPYTLTGHGVGPVFHAQPYVFHAENSDTTRMVPGMTFTIEPVVCQGTDEFTMADDEWTIFSGDGKWNAQFEHTILITNTGHEILTL
jgi:methionyl aminopeptidase